MSKKTPDPVTAGIKPDTDTTFEEPGQDESGKTAAPQSPQGPQQKTKTAKPAPTNGKKNDEDRPM